MERILLAGRMGAVDVEGHHAARCRTVHGPGLLDNGRLFLDQRSEGGVRRIEMEQGGVEGGMEGDRIDNRQT